MSTDTAERPASAPAMVTFRARGVNFKVVLKSARKKPGEFGEEFIEGEYADFSPNAMFATDDEKVIEYLRSRQSYGVEFYEVGNEPGRLPSSEAVIDAIMEATIELDDDRLSRIEIEEQGAFNRPDVLGAVRSARANVQRLSVETAP